MRDQIALQREAFYLIRVGYISVNLPKPEFFFPVVKWLRMTINCNGTSGYLRQFIPNYTMITAPISSLLRESQFRGKRARRLNIPWGEFQQQAKNAFIKALGSPPILALPDSNKPFRLRTDASEIGAGAFLTQFCDRFKNIQIYAHKWSVTDANKSTTDRECLAILWAVDKFASYVRATPFTHTTNWSALTWLFKSQALCAKYHKWSLRLMVLDMTLEWRPGSQH